MRVLVAGSRSFHKQWWAENAIRSVLFELKKEHGQDLLIISGGASGPDKVAEEWAKQESVEYRIYSPEWEKLGRKAGPIRNQHMADCLKAGDKVVLFWDGKSSGSADMLKRVKGRKELEVTWYCPGFKPLQQQER